MKIKKHLQIDAITNSTGRLPSDMENLTVYHHSSSKDEPINVGDMVITSGGIKGKVKKVEDTDIDVEIASQVDVKIIKSTIIDVIKK